MEVAAVALVGTVAAQFYYSIPDSDPSVVKLREDANVDWTKMEKAEAEIEEMRSDASWRAFKVGGLYVPAAYVAGRLAQVALA